jgi:hypothetical protein
MLKQMFRITMERVILAALIGVAGFTFATSTMNPIGSSLDQISAVLAGK